MFVCTFVRMYLCMYGCTYVCMYIAKALHSDERALYSEILLHTIHKYRHDSNIECVFEGLSKKKPDHERALYAYAEANTQHSENTF